MDKQAIRQEKIALRKAMDKTEWANLSSQVIDNLYPLLDGTTTIALYVPVQNEVDVTSLCFVYPHFGLPKIRNDEEMDFFLTTNFSEVEVGTFNTLEPTSNIWMAPFDFDVILVPLVAFDENLNRLGHGKGYYDHYLKVAKQALKIGVAFDFQKVDAIPTEEQDIPLDYVVTEKHVYE